MYIRYGPDGDKFRFVGGMISWFFVVGGGIYQVNSQQYWEELPRPEILGVLYRHDKKRLTKWLEDRDKQRQEEWLERERQRTRAELGPPGTGRPRGRPPLPPSEAVQRKREAARRYYQKHYQHKIKGQPQLSKRLKERLKREALAAWLKPGGLRAYAALVNDHDYIEAMFRLYSQQRSRLLA